MGVTLGQAPIATGSFCLHDEVRPETLGNSTNTVQHVLVFDC